MSTTSSDSARPTSATTPRLDGRLVGRYRLLAHVANGGMASVHVARAEGTLGFERYVAVKLLHPHLASEPEFVHMIADEAQMAARIRSPNVVATLDVDNDPELGLYLVMDYVEGDHLGNLVQALRSAGDRMPPAIAVRIVLDLLAGLTAAHDLVDAFGAPTPIIHRDVSPHNVLVGVDGMARLADFGVARAESRLTRTEDGRFKGKLSYIAPEQLADGTADARSDVFSAGIVLYETLTGRRLFAADGTAQVLKKLMRDPIPKVTETDPTLGPLSAVVERALDRAPERRFASAEHFASALTEAARDSVGIAPPRDVGRLVRELRGAMLGERALRIRSSLEAIGVTDSTSSGRRPPLPNDPTSPSARRPVASRSLPSAPPPTSAATRTTRMRRFGIGIGVALASAIGMTAAVSYGTSPARDTTPIAATAAPRTPAPRDADASLVAGISPGISSATTAVTPTIVVRVTVGANGTVLGAEPFQSRPDRVALERAAVAAARGYTFRPAFRDGRAVDSELNVPVRFQRVDGAERVVRWKGSDTINGTLAPALAEAFRTRRPEIDVIIEGLGSSTAFVGLFDGSADLGSSSRSVVSAESAEAARLGVNLEETVLAYDGIAVIVHPSNPLASLTLDQLASVFAGQVTDYSALGPSRGALHAIGRPSYSGTHQFFESVVLAPRRLTFGPSVEDIEHSDAIVRSVAANPDAIAYVGAAYVDARVRVVRIGETREAAEAPSDATIAAGAYPIVRPLLVYSVGRPTGAAEALLRFALSPEGHAVVRREGFVPSSATLDETPTNPQEPGTRGEVVRVTFAGRSTTLPVSERATLERIAETLRAEAGARVVVIGHADAEGTEPENDRIATSRARAVGEALTRLGVPTEAMTLESRGSAAPIATNTDEAGRSRNRRVDVLVIHPVDPTSMAARRP